MPFHRGFTLVELMMAVAVCGIALGVLARPAASYLNRTRTTRAAAVVAGDLDLARSMATRQRQPVRVTFNESTSRYTIQTRGGQTVYRTVSLGISSDFRLPRVEFSPATVDFYPNGIASSALTVTLIAGTTTHRVTLSRVGLVRVL